MDASMKKKPLLGSSDKKGSAGLAAVDMKQEASLLMMDVKKLVCVPPLPDILLVLINLWALISACVFGSFSAYNVFRPIPCHQVTHHVHLISKNEERLSPNSISFLDNVQFARCPGDAMC